MNPRFRNAQGAPMNIKDVMTLNPTCCPPNTTLRDVAQLMRDEDIGEVPIVEEDGTRKLLGVVTDRDIVVRAVARSEERRVGKERRCRWSPYPSKRKESRSNGVVSSSNSWR